MNQKTTTPLTAAGASNLKQILSSEGDVATPIPVKVCPYLGSLDDPSTARSFVTNLNCCHHVRPATAVKPEHQHVYCLTYRHVTCRIYQHDHEITLPSRQKQQGQQVQIALPVLLLCMIFILAAVILTSVTW